MLRTRVLSAIVLLPIVAAAVYLGGWWFVGAILIAACLAGYEFYQLLGKVGLVTNWPMGLAAIAVLVAGGYWEHPPTWIPLTLTLLLMSSLVWHMFQSERPHPGADWAATAAGVVYLGWLAGRFVALRMLPNGMLWLALALISTWITDSGAYAVGRRWGKRKLALRLSPKKTWEGAIGGWIIGVALTPAVAWIIGLPALHGLAIGVIAATISPFADLAESMFKRQAGVKDSSNLIPGHGGMLDRIDSLLFIVPAVYYYVAMVG